MTTTIEHIEVHTYFDGDTDTAKLRISNTRNSGNGWKPVSSIVIHRDNVPALVAALSDFQ